MPELAVTYLINHLKYGASGRLLLAGQFIGRGACAMLGVNVGLGAYAGLALLDF